MVKISEKILKIIFIVLFLIFNLVGCMLSDITKDNAYKLSCKQLHDQLKELEFKKEVVNSAYLFQQRRAYLYRIYRKKGC